MLKILDSRGVRSPRVLFFTGTLHKDNVPYGIVFGIIPYLYKTPYSKNNVDELI